MGKPWGLCRLLLAMPVLRGVSARQVSLGGDEGSRGGRNPFDASFRALVADTLEAWHVPGVAVAVLDGDSTWTEGFGVAEFPHVPVTPHTLFYTASTTKAFVAAALSLMVDSGNYSLPGPVTGSATMADTLDWTTPLSAVLRDDFVLADGWATAHLTLEDALSHRTGLAAHDLARSRRYGLAAESRGRNASVRDVTRSLRHLPLATEPRTRWRYCNLMFLVLSHLVETLVGAGRGVPGKGGAWLGDVFKEWLWQPLGMTSTFLSLDDARAAPSPAFLAQGYYWDAASSSSSPPAPSYVPVPHMPLEEVSGAGGIVSTVADYAKWLRCWMDGPEKDACGGIPFSQAGRDAILTPKLFVSHTAASPAPFDAPMAYASAWQTSSYQGRRFYGHSGGSNAFGAQVYFFPDDRFGVVLFGNTAVTSNRAELILLWHLVDERFNIPAEKRFDWTGQFRRATENRAARLATALDRLFPDRAEPPLPPSLPLAAHVGTYHHPAYQNITLKRADSKGKQSRQPNYEVSFTAERYDHTWPTVCEFVHVSGDHWLVYTDMIYERSGNFRSYGKAEFRVGADATATALVVEFWNADDDSVEGVIPFERIDG